MLRTTLVWLFCRQQLLVWQVLALLWYERSEMMEENDAMGNRETTAVVP